MSMAFTVQLDDPNHFSLDAALVADVSAAAADWSRFLNALGTIDIEVDVAATASGRAGGGVGIVVFTGTDGARNVFEPGSLSEMRSGVDPNGTSPDVIITVDPSYLQNELWLDPDPAHPSAIPSTRTDGVSVFRHEMGHSFGITGYRDLNTGALPADHEMTWDQLVQLHPDGSATFIGANAKAVYGGDVPVTTLSHGQQYFHLGNGSDAASSDLMNGVTFFRGTSYKISALDVAILRDLGAPISASGPNFNADGHSDILLQNVKTGDAYIWEMNGTGLLGNGPVGWTPGAQWQVKDTGDYDGDGHSDILLQNVNTGDAYIWETNGTGLVGSGPAGWTPGAQWQAESGGDFNGDGHRDILLQNANTGDAYIWEMNGTELVGNGPVGWTPGAQWQAKATGDFNGDGKSDIALQNVNTGDVYIWGLNGTSLVGGGAVGWTPGAAWQVKAAGDYNCDGKSDILLQNVNTGDSFIWLLNGASLVGGGPVGWTPGPSWHAANGGDYNGDGKSDILLQNVNTGDAYVWLMNGTSLIGNGPAGWTPGPDWHILT